MSGFRRTAAAMALATALAGAAVSVSSPATAVTRSTCMNSVGTIVIGAGPYSSTVQVNNVLSRSRTSGRTLICTYQGQRYTYSMGTAPVGPYSGTASLCHTLP